MKHGRRERKAGDLDEMRQRVTEIRVIERSLRAHQPDRVHRSTRHACEFRLGFAHALELRLELGRGGVALGPLGGQTRRRLALDVGEGLKSQPSDRGSTHLTRRGRILDRIGVLLAQVLDRGGDGLALASELGRVEASLAQRALRVDEGRLERRDELDLGLEVRLGVRELLDELADLHCQRLHTRSV